MTSAQILLGIGAPLSGLASRLGAEMKQAIELAVEEKNARGGIQGIPILAVALDDGSNPMMAQAVADTFTREKHLLGVVGHYGSNTSLAAARIYAQHNIALIAPIASNPLLTGASLHNVFRYTNRDDQTAQAISQHLFNRLSKKSAVVIRSDTAYGNSMSQEFEKAFTALGGRVTGTLEV